MPSERNQILTFIYQPTDKDEVDRELIKVFFCCSNLLISVN